MFLLGVGVGLVSAFVILVLAGCAGTAFIVRVEQRRQDFEPIPKLGPALIEGLSVDVSDDATAKALRGIERGLAEHARYKQSLESISTLNQDQTAQRIARQALGKGWTA